MRFLISNDDGVYAPGLLALSQALSTIGEVMVVAPNDEQSGYASALSVSRPLHTHQLPSGFVAVNGSPADCVYLALHELYRDSDFDCVITGINSGANLGQDVMFSGTFGAALTAQLSGIPAIATSLVGGGVKNGGQESASDYQVAAHEIVKLLTETSILEMLKSLPYHVLNVNIPDVQHADDIKGRKITSLGHKQLLSQYAITHAVEMHIGCLYEKVKMSDHQRRQSMRYKRIRIMTDYQAVAAGYVSLSPVRLHHTPTEALDRLSTLAL
ncbi:LOW QUALITY PROTEIN: 5-nucleotidase SurE [Psychrobacter sp. JCM 18900]|nr:LOW QUALITY PROTEIN: 5-nucleotidase SurE [Psychrobacter sp. JCM 18900]